MIRNLKVVGLAFAAVLAMSAVAASGAQAASSLDVGVTPSVVTGEIVTGTTHTLLAGNDTVKCTVANLEGTLTGLNVTEGTVTATYSGCKLSGTATEVRMNGCKYTLTNTAVAKTLNVDVTGCTTGKLIEIKSLVANCTITIKEQGPLASVLGENIAATPKHVVANANVTGIHAVFDGTECPEEPNGTTIANASFSGKTTLKAFVDNGLGVEKTEFGHAFKPFADGAQTTLEAT